MSMWALVKGSRELLKLLLIVSSRTLCCFHLWAIIVLWLWIVETAAEVEPDYFTKRQASLAAVFTRTDSVFNAAVQNLQCDWNDNYEASKERKAYYNVDEIVRIGQSALTHLRSTNLAQATSARTVKIDNIALILISYSSVFKWVTQRLQNS